jgi:hypothetical protein
MAKLIGTSSLSGWKNETPRTRGGRAPGEDVDMNERVERVFILSD